MKLCDRCRVTGCLLNYGGKACQNARRRECPDVVFTHADIVREMSDEELAKFMISADGGGYCEAEEPTACQKQGARGMAACELCALDWLQQPAEVL